MISKRQLIAFMLCFFPSIALGQMVLPCDFHPGAPNIDETESCTGNFSLSVPLLNTDLSLVYHSAASPLDVKYAAERDIGKRTERGVTYEWDKARSLGEYYQFGVNWKLSVDASLFSLDTGQNTVIVVLADGSTFRYFKDGSGNYQPEEIRRDRSFVQKSGSTWIRQGADGSRAIFEFVDTSGVSHVTQLVDPNGKVVKINRFPTSVAKIGGAISSVAGDSFNGVTVDGSTLTDKLGKQTILRISESTLVGITLPISGAAKERTSFGYIRYTSPPYDIWSQKQGRNFRQEVSSPWKYRLSGYTNVLGQTTSVEYYPEGALKSVIDPLNYQTSYQYAADKVTIKSVRGTRTENFVNKRFVGFQDSSGNRLTLERDSMGRVTRSTVNGTLVTTFEDFDGAFPSKITSPDKLVSQVVYARDHWMLPKDVTTRGPSGGVTTNYQYDSLHRLELLTVNGVSTAIEYLGNTRLPSVMKRGGIPIVRYNYDASQRLLSVKDLYGVNVVGSDTSNITYDALNRPASVSNGDGSSQIFTYGELGNIEKTVTNFGSVMGFDFNKMEIK